MRRLILRRTLVLAVVLIPVGAIVGYCRGQLQYRSLGIVRVAPVRARILFDTEDNSPIQMNDRYLDAEAARRRSSRIINDAMQDPAWYRWKMNYGSVIADERTVTPQNETLVATIWDIDPGFATTAVRTILLASITLACRRAA